MAGLLKIGRRACQCGACREYFSSPATFDLHRTGAGLDRRCMDPSKVVDKKGIARLRLNGNGLWTSTRVYS